MNLKVNEIMALIFSVKVIPGSGRSTWKKDKSGMLKCYLKEQAVQGKANAAIIKSLAKMVGVSSQSIMIIAGEYTRNKVIKIDSDVSYENLLSLLGIDEQLPLFK
jgi:uncharacterized protein YggU (UPF0235/DUF167 family)